jgi:hypothetical protein
MNRREDYRNRTITVELDWEEEDGVYTDDHTFPAKAIVCPRCDGRGVHDHEAFSNGISTEDLYEDPDFAESYHRGMYDVRCTECNGRNVTLEIDTDRANPVQLQRYYAMLTAKWAYEQECAAERRMGA